MNFNDLRRANHNIDSNGKTSVFFNNLEEILINKIRKAEYIIGCVSWLTNSNIINELEKKKGVKIIIQKERFLKRDYNYFICFNKFYIDLRKGYKSLPNLFNNFPNTLNFDKETSLGQICSKKLSDDDEFDAIRCFGFSNKKNKPLMHHKFLVFLDKDMIPYAVWTGSYNMTKNATKSLDNAIYSKDINIVNAYIEEFEQFLFLSEKLNWETTEPKTFS